MFSFEDIFFIIFIAFICCFYYLKSLPKPKLVEDRDRFDLVGNKPRSTRWKTVRNNFVKENNCCAICGKTENLNVHHKIPFHEDPSLELDENNLVVLCENDNLNCHFVFGHLMDWRNYNPDIDKDIEVWRKKLGS